jgi:hypothetical protein
MNCVVCPDKTVYRIGDGPQNIRCGADKFKRYCGTMLKDRKGEFIPISRGWCPKKQVAE